MFSCSFRLNLILLLLAFLPMPGGELSAQELPPIINYSPEEYLGGNQNWGVSQGPNNFIYVANNEGLLEFNGSKWTLYPSPNDAIIRSVSTINSKIYTGSYMDFGSWVRDNTGRLKYSSIMSTLSIERIEDEQFWNVLEEGDRILFQSLDRIIIFSEETPEAKEIRALNSITKVFDTEDAILFQDLGHGLFSIENGQRELISDDSLFKDEVLVGIVRLKDQLLYVTQNAGIYYQAGARYMKWDPAYFDSNGKMSLYDAIGLRNGSIVIGSISEGILLISPEGKLVQKIDQNSGLGDNTTLSLFEDDRSNIWVGLDYGLACINVNDRFKSFTDPEGSLGTIYASVVFQDRKYLGTNQGLFVSNGFEDTSYKLVPETNGQVFSLKVIDGELFCGHHNGTYIISGLKAKLISDVPGTWDIKEVPDSQGLLLQGNYDGLYVLERVSGNWQLRNKLRGFQISSKHFEFAKDRRLVVSHEYKGVYILELDDSLESVQEYSKNESVSKSTYSSLAKFNNKVLYGSEEGVFAYEPETNLFSRDSVLSTVFEKGQYITGKLVVTADDELWTFSRNHVNYIRKALLGDDYVIEQIPVALDYRSGLRGYENISSIGDDKYLIGTASGYLILNQRLQDTPNYSIAINTVKNGRDEQSMELIPLDQKPEFKANANMVVFDYSVPEFNKYLQTEFQYRLKGGQLDQWSSWSTHQSKSYENLPYGDYEFIVRARIGNQMLEQTSYPFTVLRPWHLSNSALIIYVFGGFLLVLLINYLYKVYYRRKQRRAVEQSRQELELKNLAVQKEMVQLKNQTLNKDIEARNRELAIATMTMVNKNNILSRIKEQLTETRNLDEIKKVIKLINSSINDSQEWDFFEKAFNHADKDFFKKVKALHPSLTSSDLRLCMYLRLNLSSKEIAPLLNITTRSVEIKRYRLRKKLDLDSNQSLNEYFINL